MGEIMFSITGLEFSYSQAPSSMKSVMQACWLLTTAFGNLIVIIIEAVEPFEHYVSCVITCMGTELFLFLFQVLQFLPVCRPYVSGHGNLFINGNEI